MSETEQEEQSQQEQNQQQTDQSSSEANFTGETAADETGANDDAIGSQENSSTGGKPSEEDTSSEDALGAGNAASEEEASGDASETSDEDAVPESYSDFDLPEGVNVSSAYMEKMSPVFKELGISQAGAQKIIEAQVAHVQEGEVNRTEQVNKLHEDWMNEARADKEIGGDNFDTNLKAANAAVNQFGSPELKTLLKSTGMGMNPEIIRVFSKIGGLLQEDNPGNTRLNSPDGKKDVLSEMYPEDVPNAA